VLNIVGEYCPLTKVFVTNLVRQLGNILDNFTKLADQNSQKIILVRLLRMLLQSSTVAFTTYVDSLCLLETISLPYKHIYIYIYIFFFFKKNCYSYNLLTHVACNCVFFFGKVTVKMQVDNNRLHPHMRLRLGKITIYICRCR
jgi:hypothetical protein